MTGLWYALTASAWQARGFIVAFLVVLITWLLATLIANSRWKASIYDYVKHDVQIVLINQKRTIADLEIEVSTQKDVIDSLTVKLNSIWEVNNQISKILNR